ncbi:uncharacterized protein LOC129890493 [Solanum dulcamara]|uniref:uncharacterized protein LOC129890493 n=1 Tax=Solanum dulcamara TaxID=45834 RepID=UPI0024866D4C|nr:uncharacterized protein LOC129890493 [Solanum dulcamara]
MEVTIEHDKVDDMIYTTTIRPLNKNPIIVETLWNGSELYYYKKHPLSLCRLLSDNKTIVVGVGIEDIVKKLEKDCDMKISNSVDLRDKAREKANFGDIANNCSVEKLAKKVLGDEWTVNKPSNMEWSNREHDWLLSD